MTLTTTKSDLEIRREVEKELDWDPRVDSTGINTQVKNGIVSLSGSVETYAKKVAACDAVHRILGVLDVVDEVQVKIPGLLKTDQGIAQAVRHALVWDVYVPDKRIASTVSSGWVTLDGDVDLWHQREYALRAVERLSGVRGVTNHITVKPETVDPARIRSSIEDALSRRAEREAKRIKIEVEGGVVTLTGEAHSWAEKNAIERVATYSPGVKRIVNQISVDAYS
jgi:osmotically-inducible protein OsmY